MIPCAVFFNQGQSRSPSLSIDDRLGVTAVEITEIRSGA